MVEGGIPSFQFVILISFKTTAFFVSKFFPLWITHLEFSDNFSKILIPSMFAESNGMFAECCFAYTRVTSFEYFFHI